MCDVWFFFLGRAKHVLVFTLLSMVVIGLLGSRDFWWQPWMTVKQPWNEISWSSSKNAKRSNGAWLRQIILPILVGSQNHLDESNVSFRFAFLKENYAHNLVTDEFDRLVKDLNSWMKECVSPLALRRMPGSWDDQRALAAYPATSECRHEDVIVKT